MDEVIVKNTVGGTTLHLPTQTLSGRKLNAIESTIYSCTTAQSGEAANKRQGVDNHRVGWCVVFSAHPPPHASRQGMHMESKQQKEKLTHILDKRNNKEARLRMLG